MGKLVSSETMKILVLVAYMILVYGVIADQWIQEGIQSLLIAYLFGLILLLIYNQQDLEKRLSSN